MRRNGWARWVGVVLLLGMLVWSSNVYAATIEWVGNEDSLWNTTDSPFKDPNTGEGNKIFTAGDTVGFINTGSSDSIVNIKNGGASAPVNVGHMTVAGNFTFKGGDITSSWSTTTLAVNSGTATFENAFIFAGAAGGVTISDQGTIIIAHAKNNASASSDGNKYSGSGTLQIGKSDTHITHYIGGNNNVFEGMVNVYTGNTLALANNASFVNAKISLSGTESTLFLDKSVTDTSQVGTVYGSGVINLGSDSTKSLGLYNTSSGSNSFTGTIKGSGGLIIGDGGNVTLSKANTEYIGKTSISKGTLSLNNEDALINSKEVALWQTESTLEVNENATIKKLTGTTGNVTLNESLTLDEGSFAGVITGEGGLTLNGANKTLALSGANTYKGETVINNGTLTLAHEKAIAESSGVALNNTGSTLVVTTGTSIKNLDSDAGTMIDIKNVALTVKGEGVVVGKITDTSGYGQLHLDSAGTLNLQGVNDYAGKTVIANGTLALHGASNINSSFVLDISNFGKFDISKTTADSTLKQLSSSSENASIVLSDTKTLTIGSGTSESSFAGQISGKGNLEVKGKSLSLTNENTYSGKTTISEGTLQLAGNGALTNTSEVHMKSNTWLDLNWANSDVTLKKITDVDETSTIAIGKNITLTVGNDGNSVLYGKITGDGNLRLNATNANHALTLMQDTGHNGTTEIATGILDLAAGKSLNNSSEIIIGNGGTLKINGDYTMENKLSSSSGAGSNAHIVLAADKDLIIKNDGNSFSGTIEGEGKNNLTLATYTTLNLASTAKIGNTENAIATTIQSNGTLNMNGATIYGDVNVSDTGTLNAIGTIVGDVTVGGGSGGTFISANTGAGNGGLDINGTFTAKSDSKTTLKAGGNRSGILVDGLVTLDGTLSLTGIDGGKVTTGTYKLFDSDTGITTSGTLNLPDGAVIVRDDTNHILSVVIHEDGKFLQEWNGTATNGVWSASSDNTNWLNSFDKENPTASGPWQNAAGSSASFGDGKAKDVQVEGAGTDVVVFDTMNFSGDGYRIYGDALHFSASNSDPATIMVQGGAVATIESQLVGNQSGTNSLQVKGSGTLILSNINNRTGYTGGTTIMDGATVQLEHVDSIGAGQITLTNGNLAMNFEGMFNNKITGGDESNSVTVMEGNHVTLGAAQNSYSARTVIEDGAQLSTTTTGKLSANSVHELQSGATLNITGTQTIAGLESDSATTSQASLGGDLTINTKNDSDSYTYYGDLTGSGKLIKDGDGTQAIANFDTLAFGGTVTSNAGTLILLGESGRNMDLRLAGGTGGIIQAGMESNNNILVSGSGFAGTLEAHSNVVLGEDAGKWDALSKTHLELKSGVSLSVTGNVASGQYAGASQVDSLRLTGNNNIYLNKNTNGVLSYIAIGKSNGLTATSGNNILYVDTSGIGAVDSNNFFVLDAGAKTRLISGMNLSQSAISDVRDMNDPNKSLIRTESYDEAIYQNGVRTGVITLNGSLKSDNMTGIYLQQKLARINSESDVLIDSTNDADSFTREVRAGSVKTLNAQLTGNAFTFSGDNSIVLAGSENSYSGKTTINMSNKNTTVTMGNKNAFGKEAAVKVNGGTLNINDQKGVVFTSLDGIEGTALNLGSTGELLLRNAASGETHTFAGTVSGKGSITNNGAGTQRFTNAGTDFTGALAVNGGGIMEWTGSAGSVNVTSGEFAQRDSTISGNVAITGANSRISGEGRIGGNLDITNDGTYVISATSGTLDTTTVTGTTHFGQGSKVIFNNDALALMYMDPTQNIKFIESWGGITTAWANNTIAINMGLLGNATIKVDGNTLSNTGLSAPVGSPDHIISSLWMSNGVNISDIAKQSNLAGVVSDTFNRFIGPDSYLLASSPSLNARFANAKFMGLGTAAGNVAYSPSDVLSIFNHESGLGATQVADAMLDTSRTMLTQGVQNRVNSLRAARTIYTAQPAQASGAAGSGDAYGSVVVGEGYLMADGTAVPTYTTAYAPAYSDVSYAPSYLSAPRQSSSYDFSTNRVWASGVGSWNKYDTSSGGIAGYSYDAGGIMVGLDRAVNEYVFGAAFAYTHGTLEDKLAIASSTKLDSYSANLYADYNHDSGVNVMAMGGFQWFTNDVSRTVAGYRDNGGTLTYDYGNESSNYDGMGWYLGANVSYDILPMDNLTITPSLGLTYSDVRSDGFDRTTVRNSGAFLVDSFSKVKRHSISMPLDVAATYDLIVERDRKLSILGNVGYAYEFNDKGASGSYNWVESVPSPSVSFTGRDPGRGTWNLGIGARYQKNNIDFDVKYDYTSHTDLSNHRLSASVGLEF